MKKYILVVLSFSLILISCGKQNDLSLEKIEFLGNSMNPTIQDRQILIIDKDFYIKSKPERGDIVWFSVSNNEKFIKRIVALGGDSIKFEDGYVFLKKSGNSEYEKLNENYISKEDNQRTFLSPGASENQFLVPEGKYFLMGDNRNNSTDSRQCFLYCGVNGYSNFLDEKQILGKVIK